jgi:hypothetical protein
MYVLAHRKVSLALFVCRFKNQEYQTHVFAKVLIQASMCHHDPGSCWESPRAVWGPKALTTLSGCGIRARKTRQVFLSIAVLAGAS